MTKLYLPIDATILPQKKNEEEKRGGQMEDKMEKQDYNRREKLDYQSITWQYGDCVILGAKKLRTLTTTIPLLSGLPLLSFLTLRFAVARKRSTKECR